MSTVHAPVASDRDARPAGRPRTGVARAGPGAQRRPRRRPGAGDRRRAAGRDHVEPVGRPVLRHRPRPRRRAPRSRTPTCPTSTSTYWYGPLGADAPRRRLRGRRASRWARPSASASSWPRRASGSPTPSAACCWRRCRRRSPPRWPPFRRCRARTSPTSSRTRSTRRSGCCCALVAVLAAARYATTGARRWVAATGACLGLCLLTKPENAIALGLRSAAGFRAVLAVPVAGPRPVLAAPRARRRRPRAGAGPAPRPRRLRGLLRHRRRGRPPAHAGRAHPPRPLPDRAAAGVGLRLYDVLAPRTPASFLGSPPISRCT